MALLGPSAMLVLPGFVIPVCLPGMLFPDSLGWFPPGGGLGPSQLPRGIFFSCAQSCRGSQYVDSGFDGLSFDLLSGIRWDCLCIINKGTYYRHCNENKDVF